MKNSWRLWTVSALAVALFTVGSSGVRGQAHGPGSSNPNSSSNPSTSPGAGPNSPMNAKTMLELLGPPVTGEEKAYKAFKSFVSMPNSDLPKKIQSGESFLNKFPTSQYRRYVYATLTAVYFGNNQPDKAISTGEQCLALTPDDIYTMGVLSQALARLYKPGQPDSAAYLTKAEQYGKKAVELASSVKKPDSASQEAFDTHKESALAMAHSGLGLVYLHQDKTADSIQELELATKLDHGRDAANFYLLGYVNDRASHYKEAAAAYHSCAAIAGNLQETCKKGETDAKNRAAAGAK